MKDQSLTFVLFACVLFPLRLQAVDWDADVEQIVTQALPAIYSGASEWMADNDCVSCHRVTHAAWALNLASDLHTPVPVSRRQQIHRWTTDWTKVANPRRRAEAKMETTLRNDTDTAAQAILGIAVLPNSADESWVQPYYDSIMEGQQEAGFWKPAGQLPLQKRPLRETQEVTTMWAQLALQAVPLNHKDKTSVTAKADTCLKSDGRVKSGQSIEWWALKAVRQTSSSAADDVGSYVSRLRSFQNADGGWGWLVNGDSDALGTGIALYALAHDPSEESQQAVSQAIVFLKTTQLADGTWDVRGTKKSGRDDVTETASYWGTCWAVIGLLEQQRSAL